MYVRALRSGVAQTGVVIRTTKLVDLRQGILLGSSDLLIGEGEGGL